uniref:Uncharacterized protein n=1 Tax=viral metagenome TaxID=1070528 RepID=A0A6C0EAK5_9ZZZZ
MTLIEIIKKCERYTSSTDYRYKKCGNCIVILKPLPDTITNEERLHKSYDNRYRIPINDKYAQYRGNKFYVEKIIDIDTLEDVSQVVNSCYSKKIKYVVNQIVETIFDEEKHKVLGGGIHYFKNIIPAYYWQNDVKNGKYLSWNEDGGLIKKCVYKNGKLDGKYMEFYNDGRAKKICNYKNGVFDGKYIAYNEHGGVMMKCEYVNGQCIVDKSVMEKKN